MVFGVAAVLSLIGAVASASRGGRYVHGGRPDEPAAVGSSGSADPEEAAS